MGASIRSIYSTSKGVVTTGIPSNELASTTQLPAHTAQVAWAVVAASSRRFAIENRQSLHSKPKRQILGVLQAVSRDVEREVFALEQHPLPLVESMSVRPRYPRNQAKLIAS